jgi:hypothetical protein
MVVEALPVFCTCVLEVVMVDGVACVFDQTSLDASWRTLWECLLEQGPRTGKLDTEQIQCPVYLCYNFYSHYAYFFGI